MTDTKYDIYINDLWDDDHSFFTVAYKIIENAVELVKSIYNLDCPEVAIDFKIKKEADEQ